MRYLGFDEARAAGRENPGAGFRRLIGMRLGAFAISLRTSRSLRDFFFARKEREGRKGKSKSKGLIRTAGHASSPPFWPARYAVIVSAVFLTASPTLSGIIVPSTRRIRAERKQRSTGRVSRDTRVRESRITVSRSVIATAIIADASDALAAVSPSRPLREIARSLWRKGQGG
jgi:hypothetical protein